MVLSKLKPNAIKCFLLYLDPEVLNGYDLIFRQTGFYELEGPEFDKRCKNTYSDPLSSLEEDQYSALGDVSNYKDSDGTILFCCTILVTLLVTVSPLVTKRSQTSDPTIENSDKK